MHYFKTDFDFTAPTKNWLIKFCQSYFDKPFEHDADYDLLKNVWAASPVAKELQRFLNTFGLNTRYNGINVFSSNTSDRQKTNPHVDVMHFRKELRPIPSRFNVMVLGNPNDPMYWWKNFQWGNPNHKIDTFYYKGISYESLGVPGVSVEDRWKFLGEPSMIKQNLLTASAFVDTKTAHALEISPGPRLIVSVAINKQLEEYI